MPPTISTSDMPSTMKPSSLACRRVSDRFETETKLSIRELKIAIVASSTSSGTAVSIHCFCNSSPKTLSGQSL